MDFLSLELVFGGNLSLFDDSRGECDARRFGFKVM